MQTVTLVDRVTESIRQRIEQGDLKVGSKIPSGAAISAEIGVSVAVVREALARLQTMGMVQTRHGSGSVVIAKVETNGFRIGERAVWDPALLAQLFDFRIDVESAAAAHAATVATPADVRRLRQALDDLEKTVDDGTSGTEADMAFHLGIAGASKNKYRVQLIGYLNNEIRDAIDIARRSSARHPGLPGIVQKEHEAVMRAIERKSPAAAGNAMRRHLTGAARRLGLAGV